MRPALLGLLAFACLASSCVSATLEVLPLSISMVPNRTTAPARDTIVFVIKAEGASLINIQADYGDNVVDTYGTAGARTASVTFKHVYATPGTYSVSATVSDVSQGTKKATTEIRVN